MYVVYSLCCNIFLIWWLLNLFCWLWEWNQVLSGCWLFNISRFLPWNHLSALFNLCIIYSRDEFDEFARFYRWGAKKQVGPTRLFLSTLAYLRKLQTSLYASALAKTVDNEGFDPSTSRMLSVRSTNWASRPENRVTQLCWWRQKENTTI